MALPADDIRDLVERLAFSADVVTPDQLSLSDAARAGLRDVFDEPVLAAFVASHAEVLITGDKDLLALADRYPIQTPADFCARHVP